MLASALLAVAIEMAVRAAVSNSLPVDQEAAQPMSEITQPYWKIRSVSFPRADTAIVQLSGVQFGSLIGIRERHAGLTLKLINGEWKASSLNPVPEYILPGDFDTSPRNPIHIQPQTRPE